jgi:hypothetical protein
MRPAACSAWRCIERERIDHSHGDTDDSSPKVTAATVGCQVWAA